MFLFFDLFKYKSFSNRTSKKRMNGIHNGLCIKDIYLCQSIRTKKQKNMKKIVLSFIALLILSIGTTHAQELRSSNGSSAGKIDSDGTIRNSSGSSVGKIDSDGTVRSSSGSSIGKIDSDGTIRNGSGSSIGKVDSDGTVRNSSGSSIGKIDSDGTVRNSSGSSIGSANGVSKEEAAVVFFFFEF
jgi:hypothetical protein